MLDSIKPNLPKAAINAAAILVGIAALGSKSTMWKVGGAVVLGLGAVMLGSKVG
jgi:hypothetical protein